ncbi:uncharacterized protein LOC129309250 [Prosopis cineraria]|uniref:uncharacterized protein LOC129309250 n=1 Tax=Prosopis cineraria TaxID=364024 RepID=UPI00240EAB0C|nr:uncharacterized protein LOC129309250 [Prosopis cineraria]XP_054806710.1 uncharacterized protein LOC129309250 [Prosopis cineraria]XP_054806711.1 uncharacterized protein LOC129309250 [Prosopis cineraria]
MSLLEVIKNASVNPKVPDSPPDYPIVINTDNIIANLKPEPEEEISSSSVLKPLIGWNISQTDTELVAISNKFFVELKTKLKSSDFNRDKFVSSLNSYLDTIRDNAGVSIGIDSSNNDYTKILIDKLHFFIGKNVAGLILEGCVSLEIWELVETLIVNGIVERSGYSNLVSRLVEKRRSNLVCLCIRHALDLGSSEMLCILRYFLCPPKDAFDSLEIVRKEWESQALIALEKAKDRKGRNFLLAKEAAGLLMLAHDGFSRSELCLHYLFASSHINRDMLSPSFSKLNGKETMSLIRYLTKWLKKYQRFPQVVPCSNASATLGLKACDWVPKLEVVGKCLGLVLDVNFASLMMHPAFHEELRLADEIVSSLTDEAKFCCTLAEVADKLRGEAKGGK